MTGKSSISIIFLTAIFISGCGEPYDFRNNIHFVTKTDTFTGTTTTSMAGRLSNLCTVDGYYRHSDKLSAQKYISEDGTETYTLLYQQNYEALFPQELLLLIDGERYRLRFHDSRRDRVLHEELAWASVKPSILEKIANASEVKFRLVCINESVDYRFDESYLYYFKHFYEECVSPSQ